MKTTQKCKSSAFSLVELVIVVSILGILAAIALPKFADAASGRRLLAAKNSIVNDIENAKLQARAASTQHAIVFDITRERYVIARGTEINKDSIILLRDLKEEPFGIQIARTNLTGNSAVITPFGDVSPAFGLELTDGSNIIQVMFDGIADTGITPVVNVTEEEIKDLGVIGGLFDALGL